MDKELKVAIIGIGKMGLLHAGIINNIPGTRLVAIYDQSPLMKRFLSKAVSGVLVTDNYKKFAADRYDAVYVTTPIPTHYGVIKNLYEKGITKNIFVEKTLTGSFEDSKCLCQLAEQSSGVNMVGYMCRFAVTYQKTAEFLKDNTIGKIISFKAYAYASDFSQNIANPLAVKGGATRDLGAHIIDLAFWLFGEFELISVSQDSNNQLGIDNGSKFSVRNSSGITADFDISWVKEGYRLPEFGLIISGEKGSISVNSDRINLDFNCGESKLLYRHDLSDNVPFLLGAPEYYRENKHFISAIIANKKAFPDFNTAAKIDYLIEQVKNARS
ncbi:MAG: Gfo/Idh/MocA family oxidoreductase [Dehalococcoidales bacterium]